MMETWTLFFSIVAAVTGVIATWIAIIAHRQTNAVLDLTFRANVPGYELDLLHFKNQHSSRSRNTRYFLVTAVNKSAFPLFFRSIDLESHTFDGTVLKVIPDMAVKELPPREPKYFFMEQTHIEPGTHVLVLDTDRKAFRMSVTI